MIHMTEGEITNSYRLAKKKREQIDILAECNACKPEEIIEILIRHGFAIEEYADKRGRTRRKNVKNTQCGGESENMTKVKTTINESESEKEPKQAAVKTEKSPKLLNAEGNMDNAGKETINTVPETIKKMIVTRMIELQESIYNSTAELKELNEFLGRCK